MSMPIRVERLRPYVQAGDGVRVGHGKEPPGPVTGGMRSTAGSQIEETEGAVPKPTRQYTTARAIGRRKHPGRVDAPGGTHGAS